MSKLRALQGSTGVTNLGSPAQRSRGTDMSIGEYGTKMGFPPGLPGHSHSPTWYWPNNAYIRLPSIS